MRGFIALPIIIAFFLLGALGTGYYIYSHHQAATVSHPTPTPTEQLSPTITKPSPTAKPIITSTPTIVKAITPLIDCVGPDGKHVNLSQQNCDAFKKSWATPTPTPTPTANTTTSSGSACDTSTDLASLTVTIQPASGQSLIGDAGVTMSNGTGPCAGHDSRLPYEQIIDQVQPQ